MKKLPIKYRVEKLLETKNTKYKKKYFILSTLSQTNAFKSDRILTEVYSFCETLNNTNGSLPKLEFLYEYHKDILAYSGLSMSSINEKNKNLKSYVDLKYNDIEVNNFINEELNKIKTKQDKKINNKLLETLFTAIKKRKPILLENKKVASIFGINESEYSGSNVVDFTKMFDKKSPSDADLQNIEMEELEDQNEESEDQNDESEDVIYINDSGNNDVVAYFGGKDPRKFTKKDLLKLGYEADPNYYKRLNKLKSKVQSMSAEDQAEFEKLKEKITGMPIYSADDKLAFDAIMKIQSMDINVQRKFYIIEAIYRILTIQKGTLQFLGLTDAEKSRHFSNSEKENRIARQFMTSNLEDSSRERIQGDEEVEDQTTSTAYEIRKFMRKPEVKRRSMHMLSQEEIKYYDSKLQNMLLKANYDLESNAITEDQLLQLAKEVMGSDVKFNELKQGLQIMFSDDLQTYFEEKMSEEELDELQRQNAEFDKRVEDEASSSLGRDEIDPETGEPIYADDETISAINKKKEIDLVKINSEVVSLPVIPLTPIDYKKYNDKINSYRKRIAELNKKLIAIKPNIFDSFVTDIEGNPDLTQAEIIPAEGLTDEEINEYIDLAEKISVSMKVEMLNLGDVGSIYDELYNRGATPEEYARFIKSYGLDKTEGPMKYRDISRSSYGEFKDTAGSRQYGLKSWFKGNYYSLSLQQKAELYSELAEKWFERLISLDLIHDEFTKRPGEPQMKNLQRYFDKLSRHTVAPKILRYFNDNAKDSEKEQVREKINAAYNYSDSEEEFNTIIKRLQDEDPQFETYAILDSLFTGTSSFRIFATTMLKEFYNVSIWGRVEEDLAFAIKDYFAANTSGGKIGLSLKRGNPAKKVKPTGVSDLSKEEGKDLFNPIIYLSMLRVGLPSESAYKQKEDETTESYQRRFLLGEINNKGDFLRKIKEFNQKYPQSKITKKNGQELDKKDIKNLLDDIFSPTGIIGRVKSTIRAMTSSTANEFLTFLYEYDEARLDQILINSLAMSNVLRRGADPMNVEIFKEVGKDTYEAFEKYKKDFAKQLYSKDFVEYLQDEYGYENKALPSDIGSEKKDYQTKYSL